MHIKLILPSEFPKANVDFRYKYQLQIHQVLCKENVIHSYIHMNILLKNNRILYSFYSILRIKYT